MLTGAAEYHPVSFPLLYSSFFLLFTPFSFPFARSLRTFFLGLFHPFPRLQADAKSTIFALEVMLCRCCPWKGERAGDMMAAVWRSGEGIKRQFHLTERFEFGVRSTEY